MPTYVYGCDACGHQFEQFQKFSDSPIRECPKCTSNVRRIFQPAGIIFKGSGWHITDYKRASEGNGAEAAKNGKSKSSEVKSSDTESAAKPEPSSASKSTTETAAA